MNSLTAFRSAIPAGRLLEHAPLAELTTYGTGGSARFLAFPETTHEVVRLLDAAHKHAVPLLVLGGGSNVLISDAGFNGLALVTHGLNELVVSDRRIDAQCGLSLRTLLKAALRHGLGGLEFLAGIPGTVGGAVIMNAGAKTEWLSGRIESVTVVDRGRERRIPAGEIAFGYRTSGLADLFVLTATFSLPAADSRAVRDEIARHVIRRRATQPIYGRSAGSVFKNPAGAFAGELVERCGLKGYKIGNARVSPLHANFIMAEGDASSGDIFRLMRHLQREVAGRCGIELEPEIRLVGEFET